MFEDDEDAQHVLKKKPLFTDEARNPIKFYLQPDLLSKTLRQLTETITEHGGLISEKIPIKGFVLINLYSQGGRGLKKRWQNSDKPDRHFVCYTIVFASLVKPANMLTKYFEDIKPVFLEGDRPIKFYLDPNLERSRRETLQFKILKYGGANVPTPERAEVIIALESSPTFKIYKAQYEDNKTTFVETPEWIRLCVEKGEYFHYRKRPARVREVFTPEDKHNLVQYLGARIPEGHMAGRQGNKIYKELCENPDLWPWAKRHTWGSWRNHYQKNMEYFDNTIERWLLKHPQDYGAKGQYLLQPSSPTRDAIDEEEPFSLANGREHSRAGNKRTRGSPSDDEGEDHSNSRQKRPKGSTEPDQTVNAEDMIFFHLSGDVIPRRATTSLSSSRNHDSGGQENILNELPDRTGGAVPQEIDAAHDVPLPSGHDHHAKSTLGSRSNDRSPIIKVSASQHEQLRSASDPRSTQIKISASQQLTKPFAPRKPPLSQSDGKSMKLGTQLPTSLGLEAWNSAEEHHSGGSLSADDREIRNQLNSPESVTRATPAFPSKPRSSRLELDDEDETGDEDESEDEEMANAIEPASDSQAIIATYKSMGSPLKARR